MTNDSEEKPGEERQDEEETEQERPTVAPPFDPVAFAQEVLGGKPSPAGGTPAVRTEVAPEAAGIWRNAPPSQPAQPAARKTPLGVGRPPMATVTDPIELEEARQRSETSESQQPARPPGRPTPRGLLSMANARIPSQLPPPAPPAPPPQRKASTNSLGAVDREWEELATSPPPPMQQELIDSIARGELPPSTKDAHEVAAAAAASASAARSVPPPPSAPPPATAQEMNDRVSLGDYTGALEIAERLLEVNPNDEPVKACAESCRGILRQMYVARIGPLDRVPMVMVARDQMRWLTIDHRAGFVLSLVDGVSSLEMILDVSGMPELDALRILSELAQQRIISFR